ncbi:CoA-binding protein [Actibacterium pelagium]|uniref:CoA-binding domain-containing protein n=1 Tax=Actibacterium pelagium TaxID=2029103 RepID=A0A917EI20_9RHOB|nr:CoA-binding protein [Actibacterium pelagium]GGE46730.1 hypothetical protein GCM10011517_13090 [Actibacterium pelagium]
MTTYSDEYLKGILTQTKVIALVGASKNEERPSNRVGKYLKSQGYKVIPVNPGLAGQTLFGETVYASLADIPAEMNVDMIDVFRRAEQVCPVLMEGIAHLPTVKTIWMQLNVINHNAEAEATKRGLNVVMDRCPKIEHSRLITDAAA